MSLKEGCLPEPVKEYLQLKSTGLSKCSVEKLEQLNEKAGDLLAATGVDDMEMYVALTLQKTVILRRLRGKGAGIDVMMRNLLERSMPLHLQRHVVTQLACFLNLSIKNKEKLCHLLKQYSEHLSSSRILLLFQAQYLSQGRQTREAIKILEKFLQTSPDDLDVLTLLASFYSSLKKHSKGIEILSAIPHYRQLPKVTRTLARLYADNEQFDEGFNLASGLVARNLTKENGNCLARVMTECPDDELLSESRELFRFLRTRKYDDTDGSAARKHIDRCRFSVEVTLGEPADGIRQLQKSRSDNEVRELLRKEVKYRLERREEYILDELCEVALEYQPYDLDILPIYLRRLEDRGLKDWHLKYKAHRLYRKYRGCLPVSSALTRNAMFFYEKNPYWVYDFYDGEDVPTCHICKIYCDYRAYQQQCGESRENSVEKVYRQHLKNIYHSSRFGEGKGNHRTRSMKSGDQDSGHRYIRNSDSPYDRRLLRTKRQREQVNH